MKRHTLLIASIFIAGLFATGTAVGMSHEEAGDMDKSSAEWQHPTLGEAEAAEEVDRVTAADLDQDQIRELELILQEEGYDVGAIDGRLDTDTAEALREFQSEAGLAVTGEVNEETLRALATDVEQQEFFGLSPAFDTEDEGALGDDRRLEEQGTEEDIPVLDKRIEERREPAR